MGTAWAIASRTQAPTADYREVSTMVDFDGRQQVEGFARLQSQPGIKPMATLICS